MASVKNKNESKVVFSEGDETQVLRGEIYNEDDDFIYIKRRDGLYRINKKNIIKIVYPNSEEVDYGIS